MVRNATGTAQDAGAASKKATLGYVQARENPDPFFTITAPGTDQENPGSTAGKAAFSSSLQLESPVGRGRAQGETRASW